MPETTIHKDCKAFVAEHEVRFADNRLMASPASDAVCAEDNDEFQFRALVAVRANGRHSPGTLEFG
ncbi:MAG: hypothetical protein L0Z50_38090 [Verrucomicrobiales bacterium]|nr:hypothetical protein [Verrucomicrobiales bacterium]